MRLKKFYRPRINHALFECKNGHVSNYVLGDYDNDNAKCPQCAGMKQSIGETLHDLNKKRGEL